MNNFIKTTTKAYYLFLLMSSYMLYASCLENHFSQGFIQRDYRAVPSSKRNLLVDGYSKQYNLPSCIAYIIWNMVYSGTLIYKNKELPKNLSWQDLSGYDFTGCKFTDTNLTNTNLSHVTLEGTTCDYQMIFLLNFKDQNFEYANLAKEDIARDLKHIYHFYLQLKSDVDKAKLLHIASAFSQLPFYKNELQEFRIQWQYWSLQLLQLKNKLGKVGGKELTCSLEENLRCDITRYCWTTLYPQDQVVLYEKETDDNLEVYTKHYRDGLQYVIQAEVRDDYLYDIEYYISNIKLSIQSLQKAYPIIKDHHKFCIKEVIQIICALSRSYQVGKDKFLEHYLAMQVRLVHLNKSTNLCLYYYPSKAFLVKLGYIWR